MKFEGLLMKIQSANCAPCEEAVCAVALRSFPASYEVLEQAFPMSITSFELNSLVSKLIAEEVRSKQAA